MITNRTIFKFFGVIFLFIVLFYTKTFIDHKNNGVSTSVDQYITDVDTITPEYLDAVKKTSPFFELDGNGNFNPKQSLKRIEAIVLMDKLAKNIVNSYNTTKPTIVPFFEDFKSTDSNADAVLRVVNLMDNKKDFYKHYNILGYQLKRDQNITQREFLNLLGMFFPVDKTLGEDYIIKTLMSYGINSNGDLNGPITREIAANYINSILVNYK